MLNTGAAKFCAKKLRYKVVTSAVFIVTYTNRGNPLKALHTLWFWFCLSVSWYQVHKSQVHESNYMKEGKYIQS